MHLWVAITAVHPKDIASLITSLVYMYADGSILTVGSSTKIRGGVPRRVTATSNFFFSVLLGEEKEKIYIKRNKTG